MKVAWSHDVRLISLDGQVYSDWQFPASQWDRYLSHFSRVSVISRQGPVPEHLDGAHELERTSRDEVEFFHLPNLSGLRGQLLERRQATECLRTIISEADGVIARLPSEIGLLAADVGHALGKPVALEMVTCGWDSLWNHGSLAAKLYAPVMRARMRHAARNADHVLYVTESFLQQRYPTLASNTAACSNVEIPALDNTVPARPAARPPGAPFTFGLIGTLQTRAKGVQTVLQALAQRPSELAGVRFRVLGNGDTDRWEQQAKALGIAAQVSFEGVLRAGKPVLHWLDDLDVYLQPSLQDGLPRSLIEAMSRGCAAIGSRCGGIPELLEEDCLIDPGDSDALARLMVRARNDADWRQRQTARNRATAGRYAAPLLVARRDIFWSRFADACRHQQIIPG